MHTQILQTLQSSSVWRKLTIGLTMTVLAVAAIAAGPAAPSASAAGSNCRHYTAQATFPVTDAKGTRYVSAITSTPSWSACHDINVESICAPNGVCSSCGSMRVVFFLRNGTSKFYRDFHWVCTGGTAATSVSNNVSYRIETIVPTKVGIFD